MKGNGLESPSEASSMAGVQLHPHSQHLSNSVRLVRLLLLCVVAKFTVLPHLDQAVLTTVVSLLLVTEPVMWPS